MIREVSDKVLLFLLIGAIVISIGSTIISLNRLSSFTFPSITGAVTGSGKADYTIGTVTSIAVLGNINFGSGYVNTTATTLEGNSSDQLCNEGTGTWDWSGSGIQYIRIVNDGNVNVTLNVSANNSADGYIGGTSPAFNISIVFEEDSATIGGACFANVSNGDTEVRKFTTVNNTYNLTLCTNMSFFDVDDSINVTVRLVVPSDASVEPKSCLLTFFVEAK